MDGLCSVTYDNIKISSTEGDNSRRRLGLGVLDFLTRLVPSLPMVNSFRYVSLHDDEKCSALF